MRKTAFLIGVFLIAGFAGHAAAGVVRGTVPANPTASSEPWRDGCFWRMGPVADEPRQPGRAEPAIVVVDGEKAGDSGADAPAATLDIEGYGLWPPLVVLRPETTLSIRNRDGRSYSCFAEGPHSFQFADLKPGAVHEHRFLSEGVASLRCHRYPFMRATILVVPTRLFTFTDSDGKFSIKKVPAGDYKVRVFTGGKWRWSQDVKVATAGAVRVDFEQAPAKPGDAKGPQSEPDEPPAKVEPPPEKKPPEKKPPEKKPPEKKPPEKKPPEKKPPEKKPPEKKPPEKKPPVKKPPAKKPPVKKPPEKEPPEKDVEPAFKDVEPEIEIEED